MVKMSKGFTLVELLVAMSVFIILVTIVADLFFVSFLAEKRLLAADVVFDQTSFLAEYLSRSLRMARKELAAPVCLSENGLNYELTRFDGSKYAGIKFINSQNACQEVFVETGTKRLKEIKAGLEQYLTSSNVEVSAFNLNLIGESQTDHLQPRVTFFLSLSRAATRTATAPLLEIQTSLSQRKLDLEI